jgi:hypothetical protein
MPETVGQSPAALCEIGPVPLDFYKELLISEGSCFQGQQRSNFETDAMNDEGSCRIDFIESPSMPFPDKPVTATQTLHHRSVGKHLIKHASRASQPQIAPPRSRISHFDHALILPFCSRLHIPQSFDCIKNSYRSSLCHKFPEKVLETQNHWLFQWDLPWTDTSLCTVGLYFYHRPVSCW